jgi:hypothetical protein
MSIDIDLFTDHDYGIIDFKQIDNYLRNTFNYVSPARLPEIMAMGIAYIIGDNANESFKLIYFIQTLLSFQC